MKIYVDFVLKAEITVLLYHPAFVLAIKNTYT